MRNPFMLEFRIEFSQKQKIVEIKIIDILLKKFVLKKLIFI